MTSFVSEIIIFNFVSVESLYGARNSPSEIVKFGVTLLECVSLEKPATL